MFLFLKVFILGMGIEILQGGNKGPQKKREDKKKAPKAAPPKAAPKQRDHLEGMKGDVLFLHAEMIDIITILLFFW